jgi:serine/threonine protein kinase
MEFDKKKMAFKPKDGHLKETCDLVGTADYIAPETLQNSEPDFSVDIWALGCIVYQFLHGKTPFKDKTNLLIFDNILNKDVSFRSVRSLLTR